MIANNKQKSQVEQSKKNLAKLSLINKKKALSNVIVSVLLILLAMAAIVIVWQVVKQTINQAQLSPDLCLQPEIKIQSACYNQGEAEIKLSRLPQQEINELDFALNYIDKSEVYSCSSECSNCLILDSGSKTYYIQADKPVSISLKYGNCLENKNVEDC